MRKFTIRNLVIAVMVLFLALISSLIITLNVKPVYATADIENESNLTFTEIVDDEGNLSYKVAVRSAFRSTIKVAVIPKMYNDAPVTEIATNGFYSCQKLERIYIPKSIKKIGNNIQLKIH